MLLCLLVHSSSLTSSSVEESVLTVFLVKMPIMLVP